MLTKMKIALATALVLPSASAALAQGRHHYAPYGYAASPYAERLYARDPLRPHLRSPFSQNSPNVQYENPYTQDLQDGGP